MAPATTTPRERCGSKSSFLLCLISSWPFSRSLVALFFNAIKTAAQHCILLSVNCCSRVHSLEDNVGYAAMLHSSRPPPSKWNIQQHDGEKQWPKRSQWIRCVHLLVHIFTHRNLPLTDCCSDVILTTHQRFGDAIALLQISLRIREHSRALHDRANSTLGLVLTSRKVHSVKSVNFNRVLYCNCDIYKFCTFNLTSVMPRRSRYFRRRRQQQAQQQAQLDTEPNERWISKSWDSIFYLFSKVHIASLKVALKFPSTCTWDFLTHSRSLIYASTHRDSLQRPEQCTPSNFKC